MSFDDGTHAVGSARRTRDFDRVGIVRRSNTGWSASRGPYIIQFLSLLPTLAQLRDLPAFPAAVRPIQVQHRRRIALGVFGIGVAFQEQPIDAGGDGGAGEQGGILRVAAALCSQAGGLLRAVRDVEDDGAAERFHHRQAGEIVDQAVVAEEGAALGEQDVARRRWI